MNLSTPIIQLHKVGKALEGKLSRLGIHTVGDLLQYTPYRYEDYSNIAKIGELADGMQVTILGNIDIISSKRSPRKRTMLTEAVISDDSGTIRIVWFSQPFIKKVLNAGEKVYFSGKVKDSMYGMQMIAPTYDKVKDKAETGYTARIVPLYPLTAGVTHKQIRALLEQVIGLTEHMPDWIADDVRDRVDIMPYGEALRAIHFPKSDKELALAKKRFTFDELFILQLRATRIRAMHRLSSAIQIPFQKEHIQSFVSSLPFELTKDQKVAAWEIFQDLEKDIPMNRLLEGDVGSGKTVVAGMVAFQVLSHKQQVVIMAPTEILARQHFASFQELFAKKDIVIALIVQSEYAAVGIETIETQPKAGKKTKAGKKREVQDAIQKGTIDIIVGTHALLSDNIQFKQLGLVIVDEQHRFGVGQRKILKDKSGDPNTTPHFLSMTATPIPRSFALTVYGDLDISIIKSMPAGRKEIKTRLVDPHNRDKAYDFIRKQIQAGRQVFVICPLIQENEDEETGIAEEKKSVMAEYVKLSQDIFSDMRVSFVHGKLKAKEKDETMQAFDRGEIDILVSTSVVEVGVNIPNASVMMIEGADRFGLAQLHQFRGRVGRGDHQSYCFVFTDSDSEKAMERLQLFESTSDGFALAEHDLAIRGPGDVYGLTQSGMMKLRYASMQDVEIIQQAREIAQDIDLEQYPEMRKRVALFEEQVHLE
ncbi:ATP-dependent DNA helicase RecG [Patescibacteria group bacterium]|nr:ATP-dependent DNA helicase RecG [Patescibacteria group bacterium]MBU1721436.1 ATP-dependent DNA helicase RecG [Patescibacteria group bacterium]MBU1901571.1 ATP-dependent DNA helicase RecG [Patescibacteria group bacterium]